MNNLITLFLAPHPFSNRYRNGRLSPSIILGVIIVLGLSSLVFGATILEAQGLEK
jgi:hypothetical protein